MKIRIRTDMNSPTSTLTGHVAETFLSQILQYTSTKESKDPTIKIFVMDGDMSLKITDDINIHLYKGYYLVVS